MVIKLYHQAILEVLWEKNMELYQLDTVQTPVCLRCGNPMNRPLPVNVVSRFADVYICSNCGEDEALRDIKGNLLSLKDWHTFLNRPLEELPCLEFPVLTSECKFYDIYNELQVSDNTLKYPVSELAYSRSDYDGYQWWTTWFDCQGNRPERLHIKKIDQFNAALFQMPEFQTLDTMTRLCKSYAKPTTSKFEFNLYSQTEHLNVWLRLLTRYRDYNLYIHYYLK